MPTKTPEKYFWKHVQKTEGCWIWTGHCAPNGYGNFYNAQGRTETAHRVSWQIHFGSIPKDLCVLHHCDNRLCVRPEHLFIGTQKDNSQDMVCKGRQSHNAHMRGEGNTHHKLTARQVADIRDRYATGTVSEMALAREFGVNKSTISCIVLHKTWTHVI